MSTRKYFADLSWSPVALVALVALVTLAAACVPPSIGEPAPTPLEDPVHHVPVTPSLAETISGIADTPPLNRTHWGIYVYDPESNVVVHERNSHRLFAPASNNKLLIGAVGLAELGIDYRFRTDVYAVGVQPGDSTAEHIYLIARGDPTLSARFHTDRLAPMDSLADSIAWAGLRHVTGDLMVDASYFDTSFVQASWQIGWEGLTYAAPLAAFGVEEGTMIIRVSAGEDVGEPGTVEIPGAPGAVFIHNQTETGPADATRRIRVTGRFGSDTILVSGVMPLGEPPHSIRRSTGEPAGFAAHALRSALESRDITVEGAVQVLFSPMPAESILPERPRRIATWTSPPLHEIVHELMKPSQNWMTDKLAKTLGAERGDGGSWPAGLAVVRKYLYEVAGVDSGSVVLVDGSGLSHRNLVTPAALVRLLEHARTQPWGHAFHSSLPTPGGEGTLSSRLPGLEGRVLAKTGTISNVNSLSGYLTTVNGRLLTFSILSNATGRPAAEVRNAIDEMVRAIAEYDGKEANRP